ncbi:DUF1203 domain-containing protein [uncultured Brevundimonas sp.]|uniref:DUF1203 domain-containing protein n=1 Tax=uncultured Brevundimonas sp. TaxID=213418 RepID=UPI00262971F8|nr:DUF1203 domain-containing protein [uncultured Brevundimonas sp.]
MTYCIQPLPLASFQSLFDLTEEALHAVGARRMVAETPRSAPCRVSLTDAEPGERLVLTNFRHLDAPASPYRADGPVFVREAAVEAHPEPGELPDQLTRRLLSVRLYDADWLMTDAEVVEGAELDARLRAWSARPEAAVIHIHTARRGCYLAAAVRA